MTVILAGLLPILFGSGIDSGMMSCIAAPMVGGMIKAPLLSLFIVPAAYRIMRQHRGKTIVMENADDELKAALLPVLPSCQY